MITGPGYFNFAETFAPLVKSGGAIKVQSAQDLSETVERWLTVESALREAQAAASACVKTQENALDSVLDTLCKRLDLT